MTGAGESVYVRSVNYDTGVVYVDGYGTGATTLTLGMPYFVAVSSGVAAPTTGAHNAGDRVYNGAPAAGGYVGWICTVAGTPGTWKGFGAISA